MIFIIPTNTCFGIACPISEINSYKKIYKIKARDLEKPLAILCENFEYLEENTLFTKKQINFLKNYKNPWTILIDKEKITDKNLLNQILKLPNSKLYKKIAFRVAHLDIHLELVKNFGLLFLTSANRSNNPEIFEATNILKEFENEIKNYNIKVLPNKNYKIKFLKKSSDIFEFVKDSDEIKYLRKN